MKEQGTLIKKLSKDDYRKLTAIDNQELHHFLSRVVELCNPERVFVSTDSAEDIATIREEAIRTGEEQKLAAKGNTVHFDGFHDQARDKGKTRFIVPKGVDLGENINAIDREEGLKEQREIMKDIMKGKTLYVLFFCLGPARSDFSIPAVQLTDSSYVAHSETLLYRPGYEEFRRLGKKARFFKFVHSAGELDERLTSKNVDRRRIYIDCADGIIYSMNTQYGGNTIGLKKLAMRLAIHRASHEGWLTEHMFLMGVHGPGGRITYFTGAFPSMCGKTSTAMIQGETIVGDDIVYMKKKDGRVRAVNVEKGMFGIILGVNAKDDPAIWEALNGPGEIIFSNILVGEDRVPYWSGKDGGTPERGINYSGNWWEGKKGPEGVELPPSHKNARFTLDLRILRNADPRIDHPEGLEVGGIIYGGRDSDTWVPVEEAFDWAHGVITKGASLESETTAATLGREGIRKFNPMSNLDFLSIPIRKYVENHLAFVEGLEKTPPIFSVNYFLKGSGGDFLNEKRHKRIWLKWMELRSHGGIGALRTPTGFIPKYKDLKKLFKEVLGEDYREEDYRNQFKLRIPENLAKIDRIVETYKSKVKNTPQILFTVLEDQKKRLLQARERHGDYVSPEKFPESTPRI
jgi:phosphoenolpyruvate carboxykinase (GTP)